MRTWAIVDGSNLYHRLKELDVSVDYDVLIRWLAGGQLSSKRLYVGAVRARPDDAQALLMMARQQQFLTYLTKAGWLVHEGYLMRSRDGSYREKGVDVHWNTWALPTGLLWRLLSGARVSGC